MKTMKITFLIFCFLLASFVAAYAGSDGVMAQSSPSHQNDSDGHDLYPLVFGVTYHWSCHVEVCNLQTSGSGSASATIFDMGHIPYMTNITVSFSGMGYQTKDISGSFYNTDDVSNFIYEQADTYFSGNIGGATARISVSW